MKRRLLIYGIGTFFSKILVFLMVPIYTRVFSKADFGYYDVLISDMQMIVSIAFIEIWSGIIRFMFDDKNKYGSIKTMIRMMPSLIGLYSIAIIILTYIFDVKYPVMTVVYGIMYLLFNVSNSICRGLEKNTKFVISGLISTFISCALSIVFAMVMHLGVEYLLVAQSIGYFLAALYVEISTKAYSQAIRTPYKAGSIREMAQYSIPLMLNSFSYLFLGTFNKNIIINQLGESQSGVYAYVGKFSAIVAVLLSVYALAWQEQAFVSAEDQNREEQYSHYLNEFVKLVGVGIPVYAIASILISPWFGGNEYYNSEIYIPLAILSSYISNFSGVISTVIAVKKKTNFILYSTAMGAVINVVIASLAIKEFGINASALSLCISFGVTALARYLFAKRDFSIVIQWKYFYLLLFEITIITLLLYMVGSKWAYNILIFIVTLILWMYINRESVKIIVGWASSKLRRQNS